jgi:nicotinamidase-related amidase
LLIERSHENEILVVYVRSVVTNLMVNFLNPSMAQGSAGVEFDSRLKLVTDFIIEKERQDAFSNSVLDSMLIQNEISKLFIVGLDAAYCINSTIDGAQNRNYGISVIRDAIISETDSKKNRMLKVYADKCVEIISTEEYLQDITSGKFIGDVK